MKKSLLTIAVTTKHKLKYFISSLWFQEIKSDNKTYFPYLFSVYSKWIFFFRI